MKLSDFITPKTAAGTALFLQWDGYHVFSIPQREILRSPERVRFCGVGGKRNAEESFMDCALRESTEEIGAVVSRLESADQTYFFGADGTIQPLDLTGDSIRPRLILEKRKHSGYGSMANQTAPYYLVAFDANLSGKPIPGNEIAGLLYLKDAHLLMIRQLPQLTMAEILAHGARIEYQSHRSIDCSTVLIPHGTAQFLIQQLADARMIDQNNQGERSSPLP